MFRKGFDNDRYLDLQTKRITERIGTFGGKLYLEFGGKLFDDFHASRVLPGFSPDSKIQMLMQMKDDAEIVIVISSHDIEQNKIRADLGITYGQDAMRLIDAFQSRGLLVGSVCITQYEKTPSTDAFIAKLEAEQKNVKIFKHYHIDGYPTNVDAIVSDNGYGRNEYIETSRRLVVITAPGPGSGKMAVCMSQLYHDMKNGKKSGYAKFETFPVWNLPLNHPVNIAYEAATVDLDDVNMIDSYHLDAYNIMAVNYNRDMEIFPVLRRLFERIYGECPYKSPTDMGVNMVGNCIIDDEATCEASKEEIIRRYYDCLVRRRKGQCSESEVYKMQIIMDKIQAKPEDRKAAAASIERAKVVDGPAAAIELPDGTIVTGRTSELLGCCAAALLNALKTLAGIEDSIHLIAPSVLEPICSLKIKSLGSRNPRLHVNETLIALAICATQDDLARRAYDCLPLLRGCEVHSSVIISTNDTDTLRKLGFRMTMSPIYEEKRIFHK